MPSILLVNDNKIVSRLLQLSSQKHDYNLEEINDYTASESAYNVIFIDSEKYDEDALQALKETLTFDKLGFIGDKTTAKPNGFDFMLEKPFLPTDFVNLMNENFRAMSPDDEAVELDAMEELVVGDELDLDSLDEVDLDSSLETLDEIEEIESFELDLDDENLEELSDSISAPETTLMTGIVGNMAQDESKEELADIVNEIDSMEEEVLEEMDLDELVEDTDVGTIVDDEMIKESIEEVEAAIDEVKEEVVEEESSSVVATLTAAVATTVAAVSAVASPKDEDVQEELEETLNILDGVEAIENEDDYLKENDHVVQDLADEFDSLNETEVEKLMAGEEVVSEEFSSDEERVVESNDLEEMITRAVAKAITKEMLQEALNDMEITVSLKMKSKA